MKRTSWGVLGILMAIVACTAAHADGLDLSAYRGKVVYLDFWASWCTPCRRSFPWLDGLVRQFGKYDLVVIGVNMDQSNELAKNFLEDTPANFPIVYDPQGTIATTFKITGMPSAVLIDRTGQVRFQHVGFSDSTKDEYETHVRELLGETAH
jgi:thiol-disulfide isomerase/thioredoxin